MSSSSTRLDRYAAIAACGSGAVGLAVSPLHGDIQHFGSEFTINLPGGSSTSNYVSRSITGGGVSWNLVGLRNAVPSSNTWFSSFTNGFSYNRTSWGYFSTIWVANAFAINQGLFNAGDLINLAAIQSASGWANLYYAHRFFSVSVRSSSYDGNLYSNRWSSSYTYIDGALTPGDRGFLALGFDLGGETVLGWADISLSTDGLSLTVHGWAFEDSGAGIVAGETGASNPVPGLGGLAALACGAAGLRRKRDRVA
jgi:hypothetical protein